MPVNVHVVPEGDQWAVKCEKHPHEQKHHPTQEDAIDAGKQLAKEGALGAARPWNRRADPGEVELRQRSSQRCRLALARLRSTVTV